MSFSMNLSECASILDVALDGDDVMLDGISIDTRTMHAGELYVAICGDTHDGHDFIQAAEKAGATALLVQKPVSTSLPLLVVQNTREALGQIARAWAARFSVPTVAITGSNGKTTVKEMIASILRQAGDVLATEGNLNNDIGVPLTLLRMRQQHSYAVIEIGANHAGEIAQLVSLVEPAVAVLNNVGTAHLEGFGSVEGIARAKSEIFGGLSADGYAVINADDKYANLMREAASHCKKREFGLTAQADVTGEAGDNPRIESLGQSADLNLQLAGEHNFKNALAATAAAECLDISLPTIVRGLEAVSGVPGRLQKKTGLNGTRLIDDSYNANPDSTESAIKVLANHSGKRYLVIGDMAELGAESEALHRRIGEFAAELGLDGLWTVGPQSAVAWQAFSDCAGLDADKVGLHCQDQDALIKDLRLHLGPDITILIKGSRSARMERVVNALVTHTGSVASDDMGRDTVSERGGDTT